VHTQAYVQSIFERLESLYGEALVSRAFGYLVCSRQGLSEHEWLDLLSCDEEVMPAVLQKPPAAEIRRLPSTLLKSLVNCNDPTETPNEL
jgi:hypothetical protein